MPKKKSSRPRVLVMGGGLTEQLAKAGAESVYIANSDKRAAEAVSHDNIHALVLTGGSDVSPQLYGAKRDKHTQSAYHKRDEAEVRALHAAFKRGIPIFGICRGNQMINVAFGGTLHQHIPNVGAHRWHQGHDHRVNLKKGTRIAKAMRELQPWVVSIHHQAVDKVAPGFRVAAKAMDGIVEAIESVPGSGLPWIVATQFHPEIGTNLEEQRLFKALVDEAARVGGLPKPVPFELPKPKPYKWEAKPTWTAPNLPAKAVVVQQERIIGHGNERWFCFRCGIEFDLRSDYVDHMYMLHDVDMIPLMTSTQLDKYIDEVEAQGDELLQIEERWLAGV